MDNFEERLIRIEEGVRYQTQISEAFHKEFIAQLAALALKVDEQNGRVGKLESWQQRVLGIVALIVLLAPFAFYAMTKVWV